MTLTSMKANFLMTEVWLLKWEMGTHFPAVHFNTVVECHAEIKFAILNDHCNDVLFYVHYYSLLNCNHMVCCVGDAYCHCFLVFPYCPRSESLTIMK